MNDNQRQKHGGRKNNTDSSNNNSNISFSDSTSWEHSGNYQQPKYNQPDQKNEWNNNSLRKRTI